MILETDKLALDDMAVFTRAIAVACEEMALHVLVQVRAAPAGIDRAAFEAQLATGLSGVATSADAIAQAADSLAAAARMFRQVASRGHSIESRQTQSEKP